MGIMNRKTARLSVMLTPETKQALEEVCQQHEVTASQAVRQLIRRYIDTDGKLLEDAVPLP